MDTRYMRTFQAVLEGGSFSRAAGDLNITQSAVSQRIKFMEEQYGASLLDRTGSAITATDAGEAVLRKVRQILNLEAEMLDELKSLGIKVRLSLCCTPTFGIVYLPLVLTRFFLANSDEVNFKSTLNTPEETLRGVLGNDYDVAVIEHCGKLDTQDAVAFSLPPDQLAFVSAPSLGLSDAKLSLHELLSQRLIARRDGCSSRCLLQENLAGVGKKMDDFRGMVVHNDLYLAIKSTLAGQGVSFVSRSLVRDHIQRGELIEHQVPGFRSRRPRTLIVNRRRGEDDLVMEFIACVNEVFGIGNNLPEGGKA